jgi:signal transduction histidine kinase
VADAGQRDDGTSIGAPDAAARSEALLAATNAFLSCEDLPALGAAVTEAITRAMGASKAGVGLLGDDGRLHLVASSGYTDEDRAEFAAAIERASPLIGRVLAGLETWSSDPDGGELRERALAHGARAGFTLPILSSDRLLGTLNALFDRDEPFVPEVRRLARSLAAQAALAWELISAREDHRRAAVEADRRGHIANVLLAATNRLASTTDAADLPSALSEAARGVTGAAFTGVARRIGPGDSFEHLAGDGLTPEIEAALVGRVLTPAEFPFLAAALDPSVAHPERLQDGSWTTASTRLVVAPITVEAATWGILALGLDAADTRPIDDWQALAEGLASIGGAAIARAEAAGELERQRLRSSTLLELSSLLAEVQDPAEIAWLTCDFVRRAGRVAFSMLGRRDPGGDGFTIAATAGLLPDQVALIEAALARTDRPSLQELLRGRLPSRSGEEAVGAGMGISEAMGAPIVVDGRTIGFLAVGAPSDGPVRRDDWQDLLIAFAAVTASALARAEAVGELARRRDILASEVEERTRSLRTALDELRVASDAKTDFLANVSHELRTPLTAILGFAEILASGMDGRLNAEQARDIETIHVSSRHLLELIDELIDIASIEAGRMQLLITPVVLADVVRDAAETIRPLAGEKGIALEVADPPTAPGADPIRVAADRGRLREILLNLLSNAVKFTPSGGSVRVSLAGQPTSDGAGGHRRRGTSGQGATATISVRDSGVGIAPGDQERIFEKFVRIAGPDIPGTGLGLPISRELARLHGGDLTVTSTPGVGSTFTVRIPLADEPR